MNTKLKEMIEKSFKNVKNRPKIYIAGAITPQDINQHPILEFGKNVSLFLKYGRKLYIEGFAPYIPVLDLLIIITPDLSAGDEFIPRDFYETSLSFLNVCEAMFVLPNWKKSIGTQKEIALAEKLGIPIFFNIEELKTYFKRG